MNKQALIIVQIANLLLYSSGTKDKGGIASIGKMEPGLGGEEGS